MSYYTQVTVDPQGRYSLKLNLHSIPKGIVYKQPDYIDYPNLHTAKGFPLDAFVLLFDLEPVRTEDEHYKGDYIRKDSNLAEWEKKTCRCYAKVAGKNDCGKEDWGTSKCYNYYAVCNKNLPAVRSCAKEYDFDDFTDRELRTFVRDHKIKTKSFNRKDMLDALKEKFN